jgi:hypothetical protein
LLLQQHDAFSFGNSQPLFGSLSLIHSELSLFAKILSAAKIIVNEEFRGGFGKSTRSTKSHETARTKAAQKPAAMIGGYFVRFRVI